MKRKTESELLDEYIAKHRPCPEGISMAEWQEIIADTRGFASHRIDHHASVFADTFKVELSLSIEKARSAFNKLLSSLKS